MNKYKKLYEEALRKARGILNINPSRTELGNIMENIFPELVEKCSKEEAIRRKLLEGFQQLLEEGCETNRWGINVRDTIAWLNKRQAVEFDDKEITNAAYNELGQYYSNNHSWYTTEEMIAMFKAGFNLYKEM